MTENRTSKMNLEQERKIAELQERVNRLENLCYAAKEILNLEEAANFLGIAKSTLYKMTHLNQLPYFKPAGKLIFFEKKKLIEWVHGAKSKSVDEIKEYGNEQEHGTVRSSFVCSDRKEEREP